MLIKKYLAFITSCVNKISKKVETDTKTDASIITFAPANCPAEVRLVALINTAISCGRPCPTTETPNAKDTAKYPRPMGNPSLTPFLKFKQLLISLPVCVLSLFLFNGGNNKRRYADNNGERTKENKQNEHAVPTEF